MSLEELIQAVRQKLGDEQMLDMLVLLRDDPAQAAELLATIGLEPPQLTPRNVIVQEDGSWLYPDGSRAINHPAMGPMLLFPDSNWVTLPGDHPFVDPNNERQFSVTRDQTRRAGTFPPSLQSIPQVEDQPAATVTPAPAIEQDPRGPEADVASSVPWGDFLTGVQAPQVPSVPLPPPPASPTPGRIPGDNLAALLAASGIGADPRSQPQTLSQILAGLV